MLDNPMLHLWILEMSILHQLCYGVDRRVWHEICIQGKCLLQRVDHHMDQRMQGMRTCVLLCIRKLLQLAFQLVVVAMFEQICILPHICMIQLTVRAHVF